MSQSKHANYHDEFYNTKTQELDVVYFQLTVLSIAMQKATHGCQAESSINLKDVLIEAIEEATLNFEDDTLFPSISEPARSRLSLEAAPLVEHIRSLYEEVEGNEGMLNNTPPLEIAANIITEVVEGIVDKMEAVDIKTNKDNANVLATTLTLRLEVEFSGYKIHISKLSHDDGEDYFCSINGVDCGQAHGYMQWVVALLKTATYSTAKSMRDYLCRSALQDNESIVRLAKDAAAIMGGESKYYLTTCLDVRQELQIHKLEHNQELAQILVAAYGLDEDQVQVSIAKLEGADH